MIGKKCFFFNIKNLAMIKLDLLSVVVKIARKNSIKQENKIRELILTELFSCRYRCVNPKDGVRFLGTYFGSKD